MANNPNLNRFASSTTNTSDVLFRPIATASQKSIVTRDEMDDLISQFNERLQAIQTAFNQLQLSLKVQK